MARTTRERAKTGSRCEGASKNKKARRRKGIPDARVIEEIMEKAAEHLTNDEYSVSVAEYLRLMQMKREIEEEQPEEVRVTWVEQEEESAIET